ncbi:glycosyltransferase family 2 protein [Pontimicrobium sp. MEBiC06410]
MIIIIHKKNKIIKILDEQERKLTDLVIGLSIIDGLIYIVEKYKNTLVLWCEESYQSQINYNKLPLIFHHKLILSSYNPSKMEYLPKEIGYIDRSFFLKINKNVRYSTWQMSSIIGGIYTNVLSYFVEELKAENDFNYFLNSVGKKAMPEGLFCYSEPELLKDSKTVRVKLKQANTATLFKFVKQHYKWVWVYLLSLCYIVYEKKVSSIFYVFKNLLYKQRNDNFNLEKITLLTKREEKNNKTVDVIIPTIGREKYLYDVLKDLAKQTIQPKNVIIVEQNPDKTAGSLLNYIKTETWPFTIKHTFTHQTGVCNARNLALAKLESEWCFFADDDIRFTPDLLEKSFKKIESYGITALNYLCLQDLKKQTFFKLHQTNLFGSGCSFVKTEMIKGIQFDMAFEFGFGEDSDFGMQIRNNGGDIIFVPDIKIKHLKAPIGGYRTKVKQLWGDDVIQPKPSPTVALLYRKYFTDCQLKGYKIVLFIRHYRSQPIKNPIKYIKYSNKQWNRSMYWSTILRNQ